MFKKLAARVKKLFRANTETPQDTTQFRRIARDITKYIYLNPGLNRHERRALDAKIRCKRIGRYGKRVSKAQANRAKWELRNTPINQPATVARLDENSRLRRAGEDILVWARQAVRRDRVSA